MSGIFEKWNLRSDHFEIVSLREKEGSVHKISLVVDNVQVRQLVLRKASCPHSIASLKILICAVVFILFLFLGVCLFELCNTWFSCCCEIKTLFV